MLHLMIQPVNSCCLLIIQKQDTFLYLTVNDFAGIITIHDLMREAMADYEKGKQDLETHEMEFLKEHSN